MAKIRLKHVDAFTDRHGLTRYYFRRGKGPRTPLPGLPGSTAFMDAYADALAGISKVKATPGAAGTIYALVTRYLGSSHYQGLATVTQGNYRRVLEALRLAVGERSVAGFNAGRARELVEQVARERGQHPAYDLWRVLRNLMAYAKADNWRADNPMLTVEAPRRRRIKGYRTATTSDADRFRDFYPLGTKPRLAFEILFWTGARRQDAVKMGRQMVADGVLTYTQQKTGAELRIEISAELQAAIDAMPATNMTFLVTEYGAPFTAGGFTNWFKAKCLAAGLPANISPHSMRKALLTQMADGGATAHEIQAVSGHQNLSEVQTYTKAADQKRLAKSGLNKVLRRPKTEHPIPNPSLRFGNTGEK